jgi:macrolide transport system ATP-binding/permease protein
LSTLREWTNRLRYLGGRGRFDREMDEEVRFHIEARAAELEQAGAPHPEALRQACVEFGSVPRVREASREAWQFQWAEHFAADLLFGFRMLRRNPGVSLLAILCLTLGIGANAVVFGWIEGVLFRPFPLVRDQERLFVLAGTARGTSGFSEVSWPDFLDLQRSATLVDSFIAEKITGTTLSIGDRAERVTGSVVSANYFDALGVHPVLGRGFEPAEDSGRNAHPVVVISHQLWAGRFQGDPGIIGKTQILNGLPYTIVGVAPEGFFGTFVGYPFQFWVPASMQERFDSSGYKLEDRGARWIEGFVRLKPGVSAAQAQAEVSAITSRLELAFPETNRGRGIRLLPLSQAPFNNAGLLRPTLGVALGVAALVLLIACANVGNLLLVRSLARRHEMTIRLALGAGRGRLLRQLLTEGLILSTLAAVGGLVVATWCRNVLVLLIPPRGVPMYIAGQIDWRVLALSAGVCLVSTVLFGLAPAVQTSKVDLVSSLKSQSRGVVGGRGRNWGRSSLVVVQVSLSFVLLVGAGLVIQSLQRVRTASPGFSTQVLSTAVNLFAAGYDLPRARSFQDELLDRVQALGGVESAAFSRITPFSYRTYSSTPIAVDGYQAAPDEQPTVDYDEVGPGYLTTMAIPLVSGREFTRSDDETAPLVTVVNETMAARYWRGGDPVGQRLQVRGRWMQVVGVARDAKYEDLLEAPRPFFYVPLRQNFSTQVGLNIRTRLGPEALAPALAREVHALDPDLAAYEVITMREQVDRKTSSQRVAFVLLGVSGALALLLAAVGLYGVMSYAVSQSTRELGLRIALGARASDLLRLVVSNGLALTAAGVLVGTGVALASTRLLGYLLYKVSPRDPLAFGAALVVMTMTALTACLLPAWRAMRTDPVRALRD